MTEFDPRPQPPGPSFSLLGVVVAMLLTLALGAAIQELRWRGSLRGILNSPVETPEQQLRLAESAFREGNNTVAISLFERLAAQNNPAAQYWLAHMTEYGIGIARDVPRALGLYEKAAGQNFLPAQAHLGEIYLNGNLVPPDYAKALALLKTAAFRGDARSAMLVGQMYRFGLGTPADPVESYAWSDVAVVEGLTFAKIERDAAFGAMSPEDRNKAAARSAAILKEISRPPAASVQPSG
jgi:uncharacterized protein